MREGPCELRVKMCPSGCRDVCKSTPVVNCKNNMQLTNSQPKTAARRPKTEPKMQDRTDYMNVHVLGEQRGTEMLAASIETRNLTSLSTQARRKRIAWPQPQQLCRQHLEWNLLEESHTLVQAESNSRALAKRSAHWSPMIPKLMPGSLYKKQA